MLQAVVEDNRYMATQATVPAAESDCLPRAPRKSGPSSPLISGRPGVPRLSHLRRDALPGQADDADFL